MIVVRLIDDYNGEGYLTAIEDVKGNRTDITRNGGQIISVSNNSGTLTFSYTNGRISSITDQTGRSVTYYYNSADDLISFRNADGDTMEYAYQDHQMTSITDFNGNTYLTNKYDEAGRVTEQYTAGQGTSYFTYDFANRMSTITDPRGARTVYYYDKDQNITRTVDEAGQVIYDFIDGKVAVITDRLGNSTYYDYDPSGNITAVSYPDGTAEYFEYNALNLVTKSQLK